MELACSGNAYVQGNTTTLFGRVFVELLYELTSIQPHFVVACHPYCHQLSQRVVNDNLWDYCRWEIPT